MTPRLTGWRPVAAFIALAYALSWAAWLPLVLAAAAGRPASAGFHVLGSLGPALAALIAAALAGRASWRRLLAALLNARASGRAWAFALGVPAGLWLLGLVLSPGAPLAGFLRVTEYPGLGPLAILAVEVLAYGFGEELGWRGLLLPRLAEGRGWLAGSLWVALVWAGWHLPLLYAMPAFRGLGLGGLFGWALSLVLGSVLMAWLARASNLGVPALAVFHGLLDIAMSNSGVSPLAVNAQGAVVTILGIAVLVLGGLGGARRGGRAARSSPA